MRSVPLPQPHDLFLHATGAQAAYERIFSLDDKDLLPVKLLGWMLIHAPTPEGRAHLVESINSCGNNQKIVDQGKFYLNHFMNYLRTKRYSQTCTPPADPLGPSVEAIRQRIPNSLVSTPASHEEAKSQALIRDGYRCILSGVVDLNCFDTIPSLPAEVLNEGRIVLPTECAYILPSYVDKGIQSDGVQEFTSGVWSIVQLFGGISPEEFNGSGIHHLGNTMTLCVGLSGLFETLNIWLEPIEGTENQYAIKKKSPVIGGGLPDTITLMSAFPDQLPLPDRRYLALHAACAKVIHMSGASDYINEILNKLEHAQVLSEDGSSVELLESLLSGASLLVH